MMPELQEKVLAQARADGKPATIFLKSGVKLTGGIIAFDSFCLLVSGEAGTSLVYKHAIATLTPAMPFRDGAAAGA